jgi:hypothetical protein
VLAGQSVRGFLERIRTTRDEGHLCALGETRVRDTQSNAPAGAGDEDDPSRQLQIHRIFSIFCDNLDDALVKSSK